DKLCAQLRPVFRPEIPHVALGPEKSGRFLSGAGNDFRLAIRSLRLSPGFTVIAALSLVLGVGANTAIFELIDAVMLRTLPVPAPRELVDIRVLHQGRVGSSVSRQNEISSAIWEQFRKRQQPFSSVAAWSTEEFEFEYGGEAQHADGLWVSGSFFDTLQVHPVLGRLFSSGDDRTGCGIRGAVLSYSFWRGRLGGRADVLGSTVSLNRHAFQVIGVTPPDFSGIEVGRKFDVALALCSEPALRGQGDWTSSSTIWWLAVVGRLRPGWTFRRASAQLETISPSIFAATVPPAYDSIERNSYLHFRFHAVPAATGVSSVRNEYSRQLWLLFSISTVVLLIACANIAGLMLARATARQQEMALRLAIGASGARLVRQSMVESILLAAIGTVAGAFLARLLCAALIAGIGSGQDHVFLSLSIDWRVLAFTAVAGLLTCVLFGLAPALHAAHTDPGAVIKTGARGLTPGRDRLLLRRALVISQVALSLVLLVAALLFVQTLRKLLNLNVGFEQEHVVVANLDFSPLKLPERSRLDRERQLLDQVRAIPGVLSAAETGIVPLSGNGWNEFLNFPGGETRKLVNFSSVSPDYFRTLSIPMLAGRDFNRSDTMNSPPVAIVNQAFAKKFLRDVNPIGATFGIRQDGGRPDKTYRIVALVGDTKYRDLREEYAPIAFVSDDQDAGPDLDSTILIRSDEELTSLLADLRSVVERNDPEIGLSFSVLRTSIRQGLGRERLMATLSGFYAALAASLSVVGLYGILSYTVFRRTGEIGIRMALGASRSGILWMVARDAFSMLGIGLALGTILAAATGRAVQGMLFGLKSTDPLALALGVGAMVVVAAVAALVPAQRAAAVQPVDALRRE
ncbi:MAG: ABC transporter permease, partial [Acidobacteriaceae bacterium]|nr:ABC transporter permease [Acidobacteriaceae bacterium]